MLNTVIAVILTALTIAYALLISWPTHRRLAPGTIELQMTWSASRARAIVEGWRAAGAVPLARRSLMIDLPLIPLYFAALVAWMRFGARTWPGYAFYDAWLNAALNGSDVFYVGCLTALTAGLADGLEKLLQLQMLNGHISTPRVAVAATASAIKWLALLTTGLLSLLGIASAILLCRLP